MRLVVAGLSLLAGCGPSFHAIYEGNARFEHCYALEENPQSNMHERADCWRDWSERYTYGQTRDRIQYAIARYVALSQVPNVPTDEALMNAAPGMTPRVTTISAPAPTNPYAPPPKVLEQREAGADAARPNEALVLADAAAVAAPLPTVTAIAPAPLPAASCTDACSVTFRDCSSASDGGTKCQRAYSACMKGCFK